MIKPKDERMYKAMRAFGGSFVQALATCLERADQFNYAKLERAFPEYFQEYRDMGEKMNGDDL